MPDETFDPAKNLPPRAKYATNISPALIIATHHLSQSPYPATVSLTAPLENAQQILFAMSPNLDPLTHWLLGEIRAAGEDGEFEFFFYGSQARNAKGGLVQRMEKLGEECGGVY
jgi:hypothetical protein